MIVKPSALALSLVALALAACGSSESSPPPPPPEAPAVTRPARLPVLDGVTEIASGLEHTCALRGGRVYCWGAGLGNGAASKAARAVPGLQAIVSLDAAGHRACAVSDTGELFCWGEVLAEGPQGVRGQVYLTPPAPRWGRLSRIALGRPVTRVAVGMTHICALTDRRDLYCWGSDSGHQLTRPTPMREAERIAEDVDDVEVGHGWTCHVARGERHCRGKVPGLDELDQQDHFPTPGWIMGSCGVSAELEVFCEGQHGLVRGGRLTPPPADDERVKVDGLDQVAQLSLGHARACALRTDATVWCWTGSQPPAPVALLGPARQVEAGFGHACALLDDGGVRCWGSSTHGESGDPREDPDVRPIRLASGGDEVAPAPPIPTIEVDAAITRYRDRARPTPATLDGTTWSACLQQRDQPVPTAPCAECRYTLRFERRGRFVADGRCPVLKASVTWTGTWKRTAGGVHVRQRPAPAGTRWEWKLEIVGQSITGEHRVVGGSWAEDVTGGMEAPPPVP